MPHMYTDGISEFQNEIIKTTPNVEGPVRHSLIGLQVHVLGVKRRRNSGFFASRDGDDVFMCCREARKHLQPPLHNHHQQASDEYLESYNLTVETEVVVGYCCTWHGSNDIHHGNPQGVR